MSAGRRPTKSSRALPVRRTAAWLAREISPRGSTSTTASAIALKTRSNSASLSCLRTLSESS
jgi:hypothetical protein